MMGDAEMENVFPLENLPVTTIEYVGKYLSPRDLAACCATSHKMRSLFDQNVVWKKKCDHELAKYLINTPCKVKPGFQNPEPENSSLPSISYWRKAYMAENHLRNNWRLGKYKEEVIKKENSNTEHYNCLFHMFHSNDIVIAKFTDRLELLDVKAYPAVNAVDPIKIPSYLGYKLHPLGDRLVIVSKSCVQVYHLDLSAKQSTLEHMFFVNEREKLSPDRLQELNSQFSGSVNMEYVVAGSYLVGILCKHSIIHIWNLETGIKLKKQVCPLQDHEISTIISSSSLLIMAFKNSRDGSQKLLAYNLRKLSYLPFSDVYDGSRLYILSDRCVAALNDEGHLRVYDLQTSESSIQNLNPQPSSRNFTSTFSGNIFCPPHGIFYESQGALNVFNPFSNTSKLILKNTSGCVVLTNRFIQFKSRGYVIGEINLNSELIFRKTSLKFNFEACAFFLNKASTRYIVRYGDGNLINFW